MLELRTGHATGKHPHMLAYTSALSVLAVALLKVVEDFVGAQELAGVPIQMHVIPPRQTV